MTDAFNMEQVPDQFVFVEIETSTACNLRCRYCPNSVSERGLIKNNRQMPESLFYRLVDELAEMGFEGDFHAHFFNEPLLDERLPDLLSYVRGKLDRCKIALFTNGLLLSLEKYLKLVEAGVDAMEITRHTGADPPYIDEILKYRELNGDDGIELKYKREGVQEDIIFNRCGAIPLRRILKKDLGCTWPSYYLTINYKGDVLLCCNDYFASFPIGNVTHQSIREVWEKSYNRALRRHIREDQNKVEICRKCKVGYL